MSRAEDILAVREKLGIRRKEFSDALCFTREQEKMLKEWEIGKLEVPDDIYDRIMSFPTEPLFKLIVIVEVVSVFPLPLIFPPP